MALDEDLSQRIMNIYKPYLSLDPTYFNDFSNFISKVIYKDNDNSFSLQYKLFYGIIASTTIGLEVLALDFENKFKLYGGEISWLQEGIKCENIPKHIKSFAKINDILAHNPRIIHWTHFGEFDNGLTFFVFQSAIILTTIHRYATIISALNIFVKKDIMDNKFTDTNEINKFIENNEINKLKDKYILNHIEYEDFNWHGEKCLYVDEFDWKTNAKYFFSDYAEKEMDFLEKEFKSLDSLSNNINDNENIFNKKNAIEKYVEIVFGIQDREYDYKNTNKTLTINLKTLIKQIACFPEKLQEENLDVLLQRIDKNNLIRLIFLVTAIKQKICLTFFAKAFDEFFGNKQKFNH